MTGILTYSATFILGLIHAFEPGHGKSILAAFSLRQTNLKIFASLILSLFLSHFLVLGLFAWGLQTLSSSELLEDYSRHLQLISPILVIAFGAYLFYKAKKHHKTETGCSCGHHHATDTISNTKTASITGFIAGLMPCPTAVAPLIISGVHDGFNSTIVHILIYVSGMTLALFVFTGILLLMKSFFQRQIKRIEGRLNFNFLSALIMIGIGLVYLVINMLSPDTHHHF
ncbi:sulfite exporter TauE/SafE family protein [Fulvivirgaceae bacterium BMA12]|uniref:Sulfite exporter TauE/SafE family protein n=1 Tax=Agaribacillus aureus TaxID=3051825 RepID=A0ABT8LA24_9BACT|nr:sulfite exporter TauE/SafE family protein [Fulvivirgaceae bacterium BMA12]